MEQFELKNSRLEELFVALVKGQCKQVTLEIPHRVTARSNHRCLQELALGRLGVLETRPHDNVGVWILVLA